MVILLDGKPTLCEEALIFELLSKNFVIQQEYLHNEDVIEQLKLVLMAHEIVRHDEFAHVMPADFVRVQQEFSISHGDGSKHIYENNVLVRLTNLDHPILKFIKVF